MINLKKIHKLKLKSKYIDTLLNIYIYSLTIKFNATFYDASGTIKFQFTWCMVKHTLNVIIFIKIWYVNNIDHVYNVRFQI